MLPGPMLIEWRRACLHLKARGAGMAKKKAAKRETVDTGPDKRFARGYLWKPTAYPPTTR
jgi:hypothetical protein